MIGPWSPTGQSEAATPETASSKFRFSSSTVQLLPFQTRIAPSTEAVMAYEGLSTPIAHQSGYRALGAATSVQATSKWYTALLLAKAQTSSLANALIVAQPKSLAAQHRVAARPSQ